MKEQVLSIEVSPTIGSVSADWMAPEDADAVFVMAHGAGAPMRHPFLVNMSRALLQRGVATLRYNFPYMEKKSKRPDPPAIAEKAVKAALLRGLELANRLPVFAGGKSFGGRMSSQCLSKWPESPVKGIIFLGFPLHPPGKKGTDRAAHLNDVTVPSLFLQGTRDALADITLIQRVVDELPKGTIVEFEGADHSFKSGKKDLIPDLADAIRTWISNVLKQQ